MSAELPDLSKIKKTQEFLDTNKINLLWYLRIQFI